MDVFSVISGRRMTSVSFMIVALGFGLRPSGFGPEARA
jgi:hypothetical protein